MFDGYDSEMLGREWEGPFKRYNQVLQVGGGNRFDVEYTETVERWGVVSW